LVNNIFSAADNYSRKDNIRQERARRYKTVAMALSKTKMRIEMVQLEVRKALEEERVAKVVPVCMAQQEGMDKVSFKRSHLCKIS
jgi:hypothetical protein